MRRCSSWFSGWLALCLLAWGAPVAAANSDLYSAAVVVESQSSSERARAASKGLRTVLVRISGVVDLEAEGDVAVALRNANQYIDQFHYKHVTDEYGHRVEQLVMSFTPVVIERLLLQANLPYWPTNRPPVLVWLVKDDPVEGRKLINERSDELVKGMFKGAAERGLQLKWPLLDLEDQLAIDADDVWTFEHETILEASERYRADTILVGRYTQTSQGQWWTSWQFFHRGDNQFYDLRLEDGMAAGAQALAPAADYLASRYSVVGDFGMNEGDPQMILQITNVKDFAAFKGALEYLRKVAVITSSQLLGVSGSSLLVAVELNGDTEQLKNALSLDSKLRPEPVQAAPGAPWMAAPSGTPTDPLRLQWGGR